MHLTRFYRINQPVNQNSLGQHTHTAHSLDVHVHIFENKYLNLIWFGVLVWPGQTNEHHKANKLTY